MGDGIRIGFQVWGQVVAWPELMEAGRAIEAHGYASLWANDHFYPIAGDGAGLVTGHDGPVFEAWLTLAGWAAVTERLTLGCLVAGAGYRNPGLLVKMATTLDHASGGRAVLGLGAGWHEREHRAFGFAYPPLRERLDRFEETATVVRQLLDGEAVTFAGRWVTLDGARNDPPPLQGRLPLLIGGSGERRTLPLAARLADAWNGEGDPAIYGRLARLLDDRCADARRDPGSLVRSVGLPPVCIRDSREAAVEALAATLARHARSRSDARAWAAASPFADTAERVTGLLRAYADAGAGEAIFDWPAPFDGETLDRLADVAERLRPVGARGGES